MIKLIALDLDDTLLMPDCTIPDEVVDALKQAADRGVRVVIATGRIFPSARQYARRLETDCPIICYNGAMIRSPDGAVLAASQHEPEDIRAVAAFCRDHGGLYLQAYAQDDIVVERTVEQTLIDPDSRATAIREMGDLTCAELLPSPKMMILDTPERLAEIRPLLEEAFPDRFYLATSKEYLLEIMPKGVSKRNTLEAYATSCGIHQEEVMACGDNTNDREMIEWAGLGVCVANGVDSLKAVANYVATAERSYGVREAVVKYVLN
ncbi:MAG: Cof-type HAD-IIB family hydrolase [Oscillospiraceae bacterium]|nr:Cof-type HAD-IIB family hydrolase [Oscillospiraceae bacterium]